MQHLGDVVLVLTLTDPRVKIHSDQLFEGLGTCQLCELLELEYGHVTLVDDHSAEDLAIVGLIHLLLEHLLCVVEPLFAEVSRVLFLLRSGCSEDLLALVLDHCFDNAEALFVFVGQLLFD